MDKSEAFARKQYERLTQTPVSKLILQLGFPTTISMLVTNIYNLADTYFVSQMGNSASGAVGVVFALMGVIQAFGFMFGHGAGSNISRKLGAKERDAACIFASTSFFSGLCAGLLITILGLALQTPFMRLLGSTETILPYAVTYSRYILLAAPFMVASCIMNNILRYEGKTAYAMIGLVSGGLLNIFGDYLLINVFDLGVEGAGISTAVSQLISFCLLLIPFLRGMIQSRFSIKLVNLKPQYFLSILWIGFPSLIRQGLNSVSTMVLNKCAQPYGDAAIAAMSISARVVGFMFCVGLGIGQGFQPVSAFNFGARKYSRTKNAFFFTIAFGCILLGIIGIFGFIFAEPIVMRFRDDAEVVAIGAKALRFQTVSLLFMPLSLCGNMMFQSIGKGGRAAFLSLLRSGLFFIPLVLILSRLWGILGIQCSQAISDILSGIVSLPMVLIFFSKLPADGEEMPQKL
ncbi:MAG: MATE family efflux transporter [Lachnospiraceae bacterium]|nr:MATE family efflux transporter [Lachnospiraceae bacterium]